MKLETAPGELNYIKTMTHLGIDIDLLPRRGFHQNRHVENAKDYIKMNEPLLNNITVTWLPELQTNPLDYNKMPQLSYRTQGLSGGLAPMKKGVWASIDFEGYHIRVVLYNGPPEMSNLLETAQVVIADNKTQFMTTGKELIDLLEKSNIEKKGR